MRRVLVLVLAMACGNRSDKRDRDGDGYVASIDCNDEAPQVHPGADELCDGVDNDCDQQIDEDPINGTRFYEDLDGDGHGGPTRAMACALSPGLARTHTDCNDSSALAFPGAEEVCDGLDNDCDGEVDGADARGATVWYRDADRDGRGTASSTLRACDRPTGFVGNSDDCDDHDSTVHSFTGWYRDTDGDGFGAEDADPWYRGCDPPELLSAHATDFNDTDATIHPDAPERCGGEDEDCDGLIDEDDAIGTTDWFTDADGDVQGDPATAYAACRRPSGLVDDGRDCDDLDPEIFVGALEICDDGIDQDCSGRPDNTCTLSLTPGDASTLWTGASPGDALGSAIAVGDLNGDGIDDFAVGATAADGEPGSLLAGEVRVVPGPAGASGSVSSAVRVSGVASSMATGRAMQSPGDIDGDGYNDLLICGDEDPTWGAVAGVAWLLSGPITADTTVDHATTVFTGSTDADTLCDVLGPSRLDLDGDGLHELILHQMEGAYIHSGPPSVGEVAVSDGVTTIALTSLNGVTPQTARPGGDLDSDGIDDLVVGYGAHHTPHGAAFVFSGPLTGSVDESAASAWMYGGDADRSAGGMPTAIGDQDGDGHDDLAIWSTDYDARYYDGFLVFAGPLSGPVSLDDHVARLHCAVSNCRIPGRLPLQAGDLDGDGFQDLVLGHYDEDRNPFDPGVRVYFGPLAASIDLEQPDAQVHPVGSTTQLGAVYGLGDLDHDGQDDLLLADPLGALGTGTVSLISGGDLY